MKNPTTHVRAAVFIVSVQRGEEGETKRYTIPQSTRAFQQPAIVRHQISRSKTSPGAFVRLTAVAPGVRLVCRYLGCLERVPFTIGTARGKNAPGITNRTGNRPPHDRERTGLSTVPPRRTCYSVYISERFGHLANGTILQLWIVYGKMHELLPFPYILVSRLGRKHITKPSCSVQSAFA